MRLVSLAPSLTEVIQALGRASWLVAITDHCPEISSAPVRLGSPKTLRVSEIETLNPDLILADSNENLPEEIRLLQKKNRVVDFDVRSVPSALDAVSAVGRLVDAMPEAMKGMEAIRMEQETNRKAVDGLPQVKTLLLLWHQPYLTVNFDTYASRLVESSGGRNVFHEDPLREFPVELEDMLEKNPELLLLPTEPFPFTRRHVTYFRKYRLFSKIPIQLVDGRLFSRFGPRTAEALKTLRSLILQGGV